MQAGLISHQGYFSEKNPANQTRNFHLKRCTSWELGDWQPHSKWGMTIPLCVCVCVCVCTHFCTVYIHFCIMYLFIFSAIKRKRLISVVFGTVNSNRTVVVLLHKHFSSWPGCFFNSVSITWILHMLLWASLSLWHMSAVCSPSSSRLITSNLSSILIVFRRFSTWIALGDVDLCFSVMLSRKANALEEETTWAAWLYHRCNKTIHMTDGVTVMSLSASLIQKIRAAADCLCQFALNWKLTHEFKKQCQFEVVLKQITHKIPHKMRPACINRFCFSVSTNVDHTAFFSSVNFLKNGVRIN